MYIIIVGCSRVGIDLAQALDSEGHNVVVIDRNQESLARLGRSFSGLLISGNGYEPEVLREAGIEKADALLAVTDNDNTNLVTTQVARKLFGKEKVLARIYDPVRAETFQKMAVDTVSETTLVSEAFRKLLFDK
ncbi:MAG TPA: TrkA family potassium uptake protein [bacterium]|uniref:Trk system potassium uptake protein TrkA n=1 Tax=candidate division TA06 bacterium ADurb.Bin417 TaxID=1852828 RepID=A0A1V5M7P0_UNCT6|nr:MAG: Trk system potassium uptake protein TrkA [candidate division TA06 bacterium ADurb.Bin417]HNQ36113.1 TrkA family potassium uptake protein [bacterium]HNS49502.1 TrkA family potassium uptake protein [bacterium]